MGGMAASGGYMISAPASRIIATPATLTGSIGVIIIFPDISGLLEKFHVSSDRVTAEGASDTPDIFRPLTSAKKNIFIIRLWKATIPSSNSWRTTEI